MATFPSSTTIPISLLLLLLSSLPSSLSAAPVRRFSKIYAFGDSYTDTGNTRSATGPQSFTSVSRLPYGTTFFHRPTNRYSDGRLVVDFLASALSLPFLPPFLHRNASSPHGVNFAIAGATAIDHQFFVNNNLSLDITPQSLTTELGWFDKYLHEKGCRARGSPECDAVFDDALFWVGEIGANDYAYTVGSSVPRERIRNLAVGNLATFLQALLSRGAKHVVVQGLPLTGCLPLTMILTPPSDRDELGCSATVNGESDAHNSILQAKLQGLRQRYPAAFISYADYSGAHRAIMKDPAAHGFAEPFKVCCGSGGGDYNFDPFATCGSPAALKACRNPSEFMNWDGVHLTEAAYRAVADMFLHGNYCKPPFSALLSSNKS